MDFLSQEEIAVYQGVFEIFDTDKSGAITLEKLKAGMSGLKLHPKDSELREMFKEADKNKTGSIDFRAFVDVMTRKMGNLDSEKDILKHFNTFDKADVGEISSDELRRGLTSMGDRLSEKEFRTVLDSAEIDGMFDYHKFTKMMVGSKREESEDDE